jgi:transcription factor C subunit 3
VIDCVPETFDAALASLSRETAKRVFWTGYDTARLVATEHASAWLTATRPRKLDESGRVIRDLPAVPTRPRRWITINGELLHDEWDKAVRCVSGHLLARPGISEVRPE